jgi:hypothetical protein
VKSVVASHCIISFGIVLVFFCFGLFTCTTAYMHIQFMCSNMTR